MPRTTLLTALCILTFNSIAFSQSFNFIRLVPSGDFRTPTFWTPFDPVGPPPVVGPGDADDDVIFRLNFPDTNPYTIQNVNGVNDQLIIENDSLILEITDYELVSTGSAGNSSIVVGRNNGDSAAVTFTGGTGANLVSEDTRIGLTEGAAGTVDVQGTLFFWDNRDTIYVGSFGAGNLNISDSASVFSDETVLSSTTSSTGTLSVNGFGASLFNSGGMEIGTFGSAILDINTGASVSAFSMIVGFFPPSEGLVTLSGGLTNVNLIGGGLVVAHEGTGIVDVSGGAEFSAGQLVHVADLIGAEGTVLIEGGTLSCDPVDGVARIGGSGSGFLDITNGGEMSAAVVTLGENETGSGALTLSGPDSLLKLDFGAFEENLIIGLQGTGEMCVSGGATVDASWSGIYRCRIADSSFSSGLVQVKDPGSTLLVDAIDIGRFGSATASITGGGVLDCGSFVSGNGTDSIGTVAVTGTGSRILGSMFVIGSFGESALNVSDGGQVIATQDLFVGRNFSSVATAIVEGSDSMIDVSDRLIVGNLGSGNLEIRDNATVDCCECIVAAVSNSSSLEIDSGTLFVQDCLRVGLGGGASVFVENGGQIFSNDLSVAENSISLDGGLLHVSGAGSLVVVLDTLSIGGSSNDIGTLLIQPGAEVNADKTLVRRSGKAQLEGGTFSTDTICFEDDGEFNWSGGTMHVRVFDGELINQGGTLSPGMATPDAIVITENYQQQSAGTLELGIGGTLVGTEFDFVDVAGDAFVGGELKVMMIDGFTPQVTDSFVVLVAGNIVGFFDNVTDNQRLETADGNGSFLVRYGPTSPNPNQIILSDFQPDGGGILHGDVNLDGTINLLDVAPFIDRVATGVFQEEADTNMDGEVNLLDVQPFIDILAGL